MRIGVLGAACVLLGSACALETETTPTPEPAAKPGIDPPPATYDEPGEDMRDPCYIRQTVLVNGIEIAVPVACSFIHIDKGDPPPDVHGETPLMVTMPPDPTAP